MSILAIKDGVVKLSVAQDPSTDDATIQHLEAQGFTVVIGTASIGATWNGSEFTEPAPQVSDTVSSRFLTKLQFRNRFTPAEKVAIYTAAAANVSVQIYLDDINAAEYINLDDASTAAGVAALEAAGLISVGRTAEILA